MKIELPGILGIIFIVLKLVGTISWSWWWVLSPFWISATLWVLCLSLIEVYMATKK